MTSSSSNSKTARRQFLLVSAVMAGVLLALTVVFMLAAPASRPAEDQPTAQRRSAAIQQPYSGEEPSHPGDRGGWQQIGLLGLLVFGMSGAVVYIVYSGRKSKRARDATTPSSTVIAEDAAAPRGN